MKAMVHPEKELVLLYHLEENSEQGALVREVISNLGIEMITVTESMLSENVGFCANMEGFSSCGEPYTGSAPCEPMLVLRGLTQKRLNLLLDSLKKAGAIRIDRKAVVTATNRSWTFLKLYEEVSKEHEMIMKSQKRG